MPLSQNKDYKNGKFVNQFKIFINCVNNKTLWKNYGQTVHNFWEILGITQYRREKLQAIAIMCNRKCPCTGHDFPDCIV